METIKNKSELLKEMQFISDEISKRKEEVELLLRKREEEIELLLKVIDDLKDKYFEIAQEINKN